jgi:hypothetical protein
MFSTISTINSVISIKQKLKPLAYVCGSGNPGNAFLAIKNGSIIGTVFQNTNSGGGNWGIQWNGLYWIAMCYQTGGANTIVKSMDGINWNGVGNGGIETGMSCCWNGSYWLAGSQNGLYGNTMTKSTDGTDWTGLGKPVFSSSCGIIAWNGTYWLAGGTGGNILGKSFDGINWTGYNPAIASVVALCWVSSSSKWVLGGVYTSGYTMMTSPDGVTWTAVSGTTPFYQQVFSLAYNGSTVMAGGRGGNSFARSTDGGVTWTGLGYSVFGGIGQSCYGMCWNGNGWYASGQVQTTGIGNTVAYSINNGTTWIGLSLSSSVIRNQCLGIASSYYKVLGTLTPS